MGTGCYHRKRFAISMIFHQADIRKIGKLIVDSGKQYKYAPPIVLTRRTTTPHSSLLTPNLFTNIIFHYYIFLFQGDYSMEKTIETICKALSSKKAVLIRALNVRGLTSIADDFVLATTRNKKQAQAAADEVEEKLGDLGIHALRVEGYREGDWILLDFGDVIVHIFTDEERRRYDFDSLWKEAPVEEYHETGEDNE
jgi:ribosome-associated protein